MYLVLNGGWPIQLGKTSPLLAVCTVQVNDTDMRCYADLRTYGSILPLGRVVTTHTAAGLAPHALSAGQPAALAVSTMDEIIGTLT